MNTQYTYQEVKIACADYIRAYHEIYRYILWDSSEEKLLATIIYMFYKHSGGDAKTSHLCYLQRAIEAEMSKGHNLQRSVGLAFQ